MVTLLSNFILNSIVQSWKSLEKYAWTCIYRKKYILFYSTTSMNQNVLLKCFNSEV